MTYYYTYVHIRPDTGVIFNVGKGKGRRAWSFEGRNKHWHYVVNKNGGKFDVRVLNWFNDETGAYDAEIWQIAKLAPLGNLVNKTPGGDAPPIHTGENHPSKRTAPEELSRRGRKAVQTRKEHGEDFSYLNSTEAKLKRGQTQSEQRKGKPAPQLHTPEATKKRAERCSRDRKGKPVPHLNTPDQIAKRKETLIKLQLPAKAVINLVTGETFPSCKAAAKHYGIAGDDYVADSCRKHAKGQIRKLRPHGYHFAFIKKDDNNV
jgi:hypothetical protein